MSDAAWAVVDRLSTSIREVLGDDLAALYVHGSLVTGGFIQGKSDLDLLGVVGHDLDGQQADRLLGGFESNLVTMAHDADFRLVTTAVASAPSAPGWTPTMAHEVQVRPTSGEPLRAIRGPAVEPDLVVELSQVRTWGRALVGPEPSELIGAVTDEQVVAAGDGHLARWLAIPFDPRVDELMVFTACRVWRFAETGEHVSKADAASWVFAQRPDLEVVAQALARRRGDDGVITAEGVKELLTTVRQNLARQAPR